MGGNLRLLKLTTIAMAVLIVAGTAVLIAIILRRSSAGPGHAFEVRLDEPAGTRIVSMAASGDRLAVQLQGGGPDRVLVLDARSGALAGRVTLGR